ncbi:hypothetical protein B0F87_101638 [Methylobacter tundripaludum]|uniref:Uncharacterized protein n=1 Tax=Methylobacter tundripaludum TaxID=173365 RepID=A0A2S6HLD2_9GAMM|nr:hypothetical protein B0F87_101638 [Methylobacter tundripaludum]
MDSIVVSPSAFYDKPCRTMNEKVYSALPLSYLIIIENLIYQYIN